MKFGEFLQQVAGLEGVVWRKYRRPPARRAVEARMAQLHLSGFDRYLDLLRGDPHELAGVADLMHITVTRFFRDSECWAALAETHLPAIVAECGTGRGVRAWSAGCCGGEEPYSLAMIWLDKMGRAGRALEITASDIDEASLQRAREGCYEKGSLREVPPGYLERFFTRHKGRFCLNESVLSLVQLERRNIMEDPLPSEVDLLLCRYIVFTYYRGARLRTAAQRLWSALRPGGLLMIGKKEELGEEAADFFVPAGGRCFFRRRG